MLTVFSIGYLHALYHVQMVALETARFIVLLLFLFVAGLAWWLPATLSSSDCDCLQVSFLNIGQGDAIFIRTPDNFEMLVDGGRDATVLRELSKQMSFFNRDLDLVVATHPDADHIGGLVEVLKRYEVKNVLLTETINDTPAYKMFEEELNSEGASAIYADVGQRFMVGASTTITIYSPRGDETNWETNSASIIMKVTYDETDILLTGDAPVGIEDYLVGAYGADLEAEILKLGHHGSKTSTSELFLDTVQPEYAVVSAGVDNRYGHPHQDVMQRVFARSIPTFHTGVDGTVTFVSDGVEIKKE